MLAERNTSATEFVPWSEFLERFRWEQGEHVTAIGPTGSGKTTLVNHLLRLRDYVLFAGTKKVDDKVDWLKQHEGFKEVKSVDRIHADVHPKYVVRPAFPTDDANELKLYHAEFFSKLLMYVFRCGNWTLDLDEVRYLTEYLRLTAEYELLLLQGRSMGITVISKTQRPRMIPLTAYDQATHLFFWRDSDQENLKRIASLGAAHDPKQIRHEISTMPHHEVLYVGTHSGERYRTKVDI